jgi:hypothetical protein
MDTRHKQHPGLENNITAKADKTVPGYRPKFLQRIIAASFAVQAAIIGVRGNLDVLSGKSPLDVIPSMLAQGVDLIVKAQRAEKRLKECDRKPHSHQ